MCHQPSQPPNGFCGSVGPWFPRHQPQDWNPTNSGHPSRHPRSVPVWQGLLTEANTQTAYWNSYFKTQGWVCSGQVSEGMLELSQKVLLTLTMMHFLAPTHPTKGNDHRLPSKNVRGDSAHLHTGALEKEASTTFNRRLMVGTSLTFQTIDYYTKPTKPK